MRSVIKKVAVKKREVKFKIKDNGYNTLESLSKGVYFDARDITLPHLEAMIDYVLKHRTDDFEANFIRGYFNYIQDKKDQYLIGFNTTRIMDGYTFGITIDFYQKNLNDNLSLTILDCSLFTKI